MADEPVPPPANVTKAPALLQSTQVPVQMNLTSNVFCRYVPSLSSFFTYSFKFGLKEPVVMNYAWDFSQSETEKYFE